jgi:hypothetical protein
MTDGLVVLAGWLMFVVLLGALSFVILHGGRKE